MACSFFMLCSKNYYKDHEAITLKLTLWAMFERMWPLRPNAIMIDKVQQNLTFLQ